MSTPLLDSKQLAPRLDPSGERITPKVILAWARQRKIPSTRLGYRTVLFDEEKVRKALAAFEVQPVTSR